VSVVGLWDLLVAHRRTPSFRRTLVLLAGVVCVALAGGRYYGRDSRRVPTTAGIEELRYGIHLVDQGEYERAVELLPGALAVLDLNTGRSSYALALRHVGRPEEAVAQYESILARDGDDWRTWGNLGKCLVEDFGDLGRAEVAYRKAVELEPAFAEAWFDLGQIVLKQRRPAEAVELLQRAAELAPPDSPLQRDALELARMAALLVE